MRVFRLRTTSQAGAKTGVFSFYPSREKPCVFAFRAPRRARRLAVNACRAHAKEKYVVKLSISSLDNLPLPFAALFVCSNFLYHHKTYFTHKESDVLSDYCFQIYFLGFLEGSRRTVEMTWGETATRKLRVKRPVDNKVAARALTSIELFDGAFGITDMAVDSSL
jgi:hypothetical protein